MSNSKTDSAVTKTDSGVFQYVFKSPHDAIVFAYSVDKAMREKDLRLVVMLAMGALGWEVDKETVNEGHGVQDMVNSGYKFGPTVRIAKGIFVAVSVEIQLANGEPYSFTFENETLRDDTKTNCGNPWEWYLKIPEVVGTRLLRKSSWSQSKRLNP